MTGDIQYKSIEYKFKEQRFYEDYYSLYSIGREYWKPPHKYYHDCNNTIAKQCVFQYTVSGEGMLACGSKLHAMKPGQAFLVERPGQYKYYRPDTSSGHWDIKFISFNMASLKIWRDVTERYGRIVQLRPDSAVLQYWDWIYEKALKGKLDNFFLASGYAYNFFMHLYDSLSQEEESRSYGDFVQTCVDMIQTHYKEDLTLDSLAAACNVSSSYLSKRFKGSLNCSPIQYLNKHRLEIACSLLLRSPMRIEDVAAEMGFSSANYFSRLFKSAMGVSPRKYRERELARVVENRMQRLEITPHGIVDLWEKDTGADGR
jgi:AraC-like DNA-binding protein